MNQQETRHNFPIDNLTYDVITVIHEKSKGLEAFDRYLNDSQGNAQVKEIFQRIRQFDSQCVKDLCECLPSLSSVQSYTGAGGKSGG